MRLTEPLSFRHSLNARKHLRKQLDLPVTYNNQGVSELMFSPNRTTHPERVSCRCSCRSSPAYVQVDQMITVGAWSDCQCGGKGRESLA